jgi:hypothetical protein
VARQVECDGFVDILEKKYLGATKKYWLTRNFILPSLPLFLCN